VLHGRDYWRSVGDLRLLRRYERERKAALLPMRLTTDSLQQLFARREAPVQLLRNLGLRGFEHSGPLKTWMAKQAMGAAQSA
jgi:2-polyprenyl-6-methoxyphenol hydroxylase-like FAD-dependent oxidoreductase